MKIKTDVSDITVGKVYSKKDPNKNISAKNFKSTQTGQINNQSNLQKAGKPTFDRSLGSAFSIAQVSNNIIQKAILISSRLKSIAAQAIASGKIDTSQMEIALSDINSTIDSYNLNVVAPIQS